MKKRTIGILLLIISILLSISNFGMTGAVIGTPLSNSFTFLAIILFILGIILATYHERNYAQEILAQRRYVDNTRELKKIARKMGYHLDEGHKEGTRVYDGQTVLTVIPHHRKVQGRGTVKNILESLATGESSFRKRTA